MYYYNSTDKGKSLEVTEEFIENYLLFLQKVHK